MSNNFTAASLMDSVENNDILITDLLHSLENNDLNLVKFKTKTGTIRQMGCTRMLSAIPKATHDGRFDPQLNRENIICVYDFQNSSWRAFRKDRVVSFTTV